ncbi:L,D-transpeptidase family protein [Novosphingobium lentum]|uniref:L,D-transpeptidase family protein n=1 Tax=Novosphingobium lentum TaxID=145287 RepID=UPI00083383D7|nr:L,D-transpeptidase family protein [Novosphingobium lentum]
MAGFGGLAIFQKRIVQVSLGMVAMGLASALAFHTGQDVAQTFFDRGDGAPKKAASVAVAPASTAPASAAAGSAAKPDPQLAAAVPADSPFVVKSILKIDGPIKFGQYFWDESKAPATGPVVITVDLQARTLSMFRDGHEIGAAAILKGYGDKPTPVGTFPILGKDADHHSSIYDNAPMPFTMRLTNDGVSIHGSKVELGYATNGCVGVPEAFAKKLFGQARVGDKVIITDGKRIGVGDPIIANTAPGAGPA